MMMPLSVARDLIRQLNELALKGAVDDSMFSKAANNHLLTMLAWYARVAESRLENLCGFCSVAAAPPGLGVNHG